MNANLETPDDNAFGDTDPICYGCRSPKADATYRIVWDDVLCEACAQARARADQGRDTGIDAALVDAGCSRVA